MWAGDIGLSLATVVLSKYRINGERKIKWLVSGGRVLFSFFVFGLFLAYFWVFFFPSASIKFSSLWRRSTGRVIWFFITLLTLHFILLPIVIIQLEFDILLPMILIVNSNNVCSKYLFITIRLIISFFFVIVFREAIFVFSSIN